MPLTAYSQPKILDQVFGNAIACVRTGIAIGGAATTINIGSTATGGASGNADVTPSSLGLILICTPGTGATQNQYSMISAYKITSSTATAMTLPASTVASGAISVGDFIFQLGTTTTQSTLLENTLYVGLSTVGAQTTVTAASDLATLPTGTINVVAVTGANSTFPGGGGTILVDTSNGLQTVAYTACSGTTFTGCTGGTGIMDTSSTVTLVPTNATILSSEPSSTGSYARVAMLNNAGNFTAASGSNPATKTTGAVCTFPASTAAWSTGATACNLFFLADVSTLAGGNVITYGYLTTSQTVNASGITPSFAAGALSATLL